MNLGFAKTFHQCTKYSTIPRKLFEFSKPGLRYHKHRHRDRVQFLVQDILSIDFGSNGSILFDLIFCMISSDGKSWLQVYSDRICVLLIFQCFYRRRQRSLIQQQLLLLLLLWLFFHALLYYIWGGWRQRPSVYHTEPSKAGATTKNSFNKPRTRRHLLQYCSNGPCDQ